MILIRFGLALLLILMITGQAMAADVKVLPSSYLANQGGTFELNITLDPQGAAIAGAQLNIEFDQTKIQINKITEGTLFKQNGASTFFAEGSINNSTGTVINIFDLVIGRTNVSNPGTFIIINGTAIGSSGTSRINLSNVKISNPDAQPVPPVVYNGSMTINSPPVLLEVRDKKIFEGQAFTSTLSATDIDSDTLTYSASNLPAGATFDPATKTFSWIPDFTGSGIYPDVHFEVSDGTFTDFENITITVNKRSNIIVTPSSKIVNTGQTFSLNISIDPMGNPIAGAELSLMYDSSLLNVNNVTEGNLFKQNESSMVFNCIVIENPSGKVNNINISIPDPYNVTNEETFIVINMTAIGKSGTSYFNLSDVKISDPDGVGIPFNVTNGSVTINLINGRVIDSVTKAGIAGVKVFSNESISTTTDASGFYSLSVISGTNITATFEPAYYTNSTGISTLLSPVGVQDIWLVKKPTGNITGSVTNIYN